MCCNVYNPYQTWRPTQSTDAMHLSFCVNWNQKVRHKWHIGTFGSTPKCFSCSCSFVVTFILIHLWWPMCDRGWLGVLNTMHDWENDPWQHYVGRDLNIIFFWRLDLNKFIAGMWKMAIHDVSLSSDANNKRFEYWWMESEVWTWLIFGW